MRVAAIDCGTNSIRLLIADVVDGQVTDVERLMTVVRLGEGVDVTGRLAPAALARTWTAVEDYAARIEAAGAEAVRMVATSASRDAENSAEFVEGVVARLGHAPEVISGAGVVPTFSGRPIWAKGTLEMYIQLVPPISRSP